MLWRSALKKYNEQRGTTIQDNWISVKEKLPTRNYSTVIIYDPELIEGMAIAIFDGRNFNAISNGVAGDIYKTVTHWMPLPEPPEELPKTNQP